MNWFLYNRDLCHERVKCKVQSSVIVGLGCNTNRNPVDTGRKLNVHKTLRRPPERLMYVQFTSCVYGEQKGVAEVEIFEFGNFQTLSRVILLTQNGRYFVVCTMNVFFMTVLSWKLFQCPARIKKSFLYTRFTPEPSCLKKSKNSLQHSSMDVFHDVFKFYKLYQIAQSVTYFLIKKNRLLEKRHLGKHPKIAQSGLHPPKWSTSAF